MKATGVNKKERERERERENIRKRRVKQRDEMRYYKKITKQRHP